METIQVKEILPPEYHKRVHVKVLEIEIPRDSFKGPTKVEDSNEIHLFNQNKSEELIFSPYPDEPQVIMVHKTYIDGPGVATGTFIEYHENGDMAYGKFLIE